MTIRQLISMCDNIKPHTKIMVFDSAEDFDNCTSNWTTYTANNLSNIYADIAKFRVYSDFVAVALA